MAGRFKVRQLVYDAWWPWQVGQVLACSPNFCRVRYEAGKIVRYDKPHMKFLRAVNATSTSVRPK